MKRREEREQAFVLLFEKIFHDEPLPEMIQDVLDARDEKVSAFAQNVVKGVEEHKEEIDEEIRANALGWKVKRISKVALAVMRLALYEIFYEKEIPVSVSINEAVEITKKFATDEDASFINGILGNICKKLDGKAADAE